MILLLASLVSCQNFAFLYAGSADFYNYRHQADIFTIYTQLLERGFRKEQILLCAFDDIASSPSNPFQGQIFHSLDHKINVYPGQESINYRGAEVNAKLYTDTVANFPTTSEDNIFMYYDNHGGPNLLGSPTGDLISAHNLLFAFQDAEPKKLYKKVLFVIEACYSGSVAMVLSNLTNVGIITAANNLESSYAAVYDSKVGTYLTNEFTNYFCSLIDEKPDISIGEFFSIIEKEMEQSHACIFGDESIRSMLISDFLGKPKNNRKFALTHNKDKSTFLLAKPKDATQKTLDHFAKHPKACIRAKARLESLRIKALSEKLDAVLELLVNYVDPANFDVIMNDTESDATPDYYSIVKVFSEKFGEINPDDYGRFNVLKALAARHSKAKILQGIFAVVF